MSTSSQDLVKRFHSLTPQGPFNPIGISANESSASYESDQSNTKEPSTSSGPQKTSKPRLRKKKKKETVVLAKPDANSMKFFSRDKSDLQKEKNRCISGVFVRGYGVIPVIQGDFKAIPIKAQTFIEEKARIMQPRAIFICDGSSFEYDQIMHELERLQQVRRLDGAGPDVFLTRSSCADTKRRDSKTFISTKRRVTTEADKGRDVKNYFTNWMCPGQFRITLAQRFPACMRGRVMYVVPFSMGPIGSYNSINGVQLTDNPYVVAHSHILTRVSAAVWDAMGDSNFVGCVHSIGLPRPVTAKLPQNWLCNTAKMFIGHCMDKQEVWSFGSSAIDNALASKKCLSLRVASVIGRDQGWLAEHMAIISVANPQGAEFFIGVASSSKGGKTALGMTKPSSVPGWKIQVISDDVAWLKFDEKDGRMHAMNPENGIFGIAAHTKLADCPAIAEMTSKNTIFTNVAETSDGRAWWQGIGEELPDGVTITSWRGKDLGILSASLSKRTRSASQFSHEKGILADHNGRFAAPYKQCNIIHPKWDDPKGVPLSAIVFGCRRSEGLPLIIESLSWNHGVFMGSSLCSENVTKDRTVRFDPMCMRSFISYNFADYVRHWLEMDKPGRKMPKIFVGNWFRRDMESDNLLWPGGGDNIRVLDWITRRVSAGQSEGSLIDVNDFKETQLGIQPTMKHFNLQGMHKVDWDQLMGVPIEFWSKECGVIEAFFNEQMGQAIPEQIKNELVALQNRLKQNVYNNNVN